MSNSSNETRALTPDASAITPRAEAGSTLRSALRRLDAVWPVLLTLLIIVVLWEGAIRLFKIPPFVLPHLTAVAERMGQDGSLLRTALFATVGESLGGFVLGGLIGVLLGVVLHSSKALERIVMPVLVAVNSVPIVGYVPLTLIWFGMGSASKVALVALSTGFVVLVNALHGLKRAEPAAIGLMRSFGASRLSILRRLQLPAALPSIVTGLRVALPRSMVIAIVSEMLGAYQGIGRIIFESTQQVDYLGVWVAVVSASLASMILYGAIAAIDKRLVWWQ
ncbi:ABC transporter permease [Robbsia sp. KACC 23696]|uniref:ABC transporter permease n=1 Tax=Robbsia sp. KACC 23696 TaxID=3149231 RepID=UPI00325AD320